MEETKAGSPGTSPQTVNTVEIYTHGTITNRGLRKTTDETKRPKRIARRRSKITTFSRASAARLRRFLVKAKGPDGWVCFGATLTIPGPVIGETEMRRMWDAYCQRLRRLGNIALIWRIELQERGQPHIHCICWGKRGPGRLREYWEDALALLGPYEGPADIDIEGSRRCSDGNYSEFKPGWIKCSSRGYWPGASEHAVKTEGLDAGDSIGWWRYIASHTSKSKQAQLGWQGRQWGAVNRHLLDEAEPVLIELKTTAMDKTIRKLRKVTGCRFASGHGRQAWFDKPDTSLRLCEWAKAEAGV